MDKPPICLSLFAPRILSTTQLGDNNNVVPDSDGNRQAEAEAAGAGVDSYFILDTGAPVHATGNQALLADARDLGPIGDAAVSLTRRDGQVLRATSVGVVRRGASFLLADVHCFPGLPPASTLVSVPQLTRRGLSVVFSGPTCAVRDGNTGPVVGEGRLERITTYLVMC